MKKVVYEGITFYAEVNAGKTFTDFLKHEGHHSLTKEQLKEAHELCKEAIKPREEKSEA